MRGGIGDLFSGLTMMSRACWSRVLGFPPRRSTALSSYAYLTFRIEMTSNSNETQIGRLRRRLNVPFNFRASSGCTEMLDSALHSVALAIGFRRVDRVVVGCPRLEPVHAHAENGIGMARV